MPWTDTETLKYDLIDRGGDLNGRCVLTTEPDAASGTTKLSHLCNDVTEQHRDDRVTEVESDTLAPISAERTIRNLEKGTATTYSSAYDGGTVHLTADVDGKTNETTRDIPKATEKVPEPAWYDDESLFWIIRAIPLTKGYEGTYTNLNAANGRVFDVRVKVEDQESVTVPAGTFDAWKVRISTDSVVQEFMIEAAAPHRVVHARIERVNYELTAAE